MEQHLGQQLYEKWPIFLQSEVKPPFKQLVKTGSIPLLSAMMSSRLDFLDDI